MKHNLHGDVPEEHRVLAVQLEELEAHFDSKVGIYDNDAIAKGYLCVAYDWYDIGDDDKGADLLKKADTVCPGYFECEMKEHTENDPEYASLVQDLSAIILESAKDILFFGKNES